MAALKARPTAADVDAFLDSVPNPVRRADGRALKVMMERTTGEKAVMWGTGMVGFGAYDDVTGSGWHGCYFLTGFAPRKTALTLYVMPGFSDFASLLGRLGKHRTAKSCLYVNKLADIDMVVLEDLIAASVAAMRARYPTSGDA